MPVYGKCPTSPRYADEHSATATLLPLVPPALLEKRVFDSGFEIARER
jgi:hypothetical protein